MPQVVHSSNMYNTKNKMQENKKIKKKKNQEKISPNSEIGKLECIYLKK